MRFLKAAAILGCFTAAASAQHADFVLFGDSFKGSGAQYTPEQKFVHPISAPYFNEDSFVTTDLRGWFLYHKFPKGGVIDGGDAKVYAAEIRVALTEQIQLVAYKDGYTDLDSGLLQDDGWNDIAAGLKWNFLQDWKNQFHAAVGAGYEFPIGDPDVLHNNGEVRLWGSVNKGFGPLHLGATGNVFFGTSGDEPFGNSDYFAWHAHMDYYVCKQFSPVIEFNGYHVFNENDEVLPFSGMDITNLGGGDDVVTMAVGGEIRPCEPFAIRGAYEFPLTSGDDLIDYRVTLSFVWSF